MAFLMIDSHARDQLRGELAVTISCARELERYADSVAGPDNDFARLRRRVDVALHLLDDVGWQWDDSREVYYLTARRADLRWWIEERLEGIDESLRKYAEVLALGGHVHSPAHIRWANRSAEQLASSEVDDAREESDRELDVRTVLLALLEQLDREGVE